MYKRISFHNLVVVVVVMDPLPPPPPPTPSSCMHYEEEEEGGLLNPEKVMDSLPPPPPTPSSSSPCMRYEGGLLLNPERVLFLTLNLILFIVMINVLIFCPIVERNNNNEDIKQMIMSLNDEDENFKQMIISSLLKSTTTTTTTTLSNEDYIKQMKLMLTLSNKKRNKNRADPTVIVTDNAIISSALPFYQYNNTNCPYQFRLYDNKRISVCLNSTVVDIRQFIGDKPSIKGLNIFKRDWIKFVNVIPYISELMLLV